MLFLVLDDTGFGFGQLGFLVSSGVTGAPIRTPTLDGLAAGGVRYSNFQTTAKRASRAHDAGTSDGGSTPASSVESFHGLRCYA